MKIEVGKTYETRRGQRVRIICTDAKSNDYPVVGLIDHNGHEVVEIWTVSGETYSTGEKSNSDIVKEVRDPIQYWVVVDKSGYWDHAYCSKESAECMCNHDRGQRVIKMVEAQE